MLQMMFKFELKQKDASKVRKCMLVVDVSYTVGSMHTCYKSQPRDLTANLIQEPIRLRETQESQLVLFSSD